MGYFSVRDDLDRAVVWGGTPPVGVVTLCGSTRFKDAYDAENRRLTLEGYVVLSCGAWERSSPPYADVTDEQKRNLDVTHKRKIDLSDEVRVINVGGYVGESTRSEIDYALRYGKRVSCLEATA